VEVLIPEFALRRGLQAALPDARIGRVEQRQGADAVGMTQGQRLGDRRADVVASDHHAGNLQAVEQGEDVSGQDAGCEP
jgi:hypothetical protein